jgi:hypothetical protein
MRIGHLFEIGSRLALPLSMFVRFELQSFKMWKMSKKVDGS